jgi:hypothetical protein
MWRESDATRRRWENRARTRGAKEYRILKGSSEMASFTMDRKLPWTEKVE